MIKTIKKLYCDIFKSNTIQIEYNTLQDVLHSFVIRYKLINDITLYDYNKTINFNYHKFSNIYHIFIISSYKDLALFSSDYMYLELITALLRHKDV